MIGQAQSYRYYENEGFEKGYGKWENVDYDDIDWIRTSKPTPSYKTGPNRASKGSKYLYLEASNGDHNKSGSLVREIDLTHANASVMFGIDYMIYGRDGGKLWLTIAYGDNYNLHAHIPVATGKRGNSKQQWERKRISLKDYRGGKIKLTVRGITGSGYRGDVAIDAILVYDTVKKNASYVFLENESFEKGYGKWENAKYYDDIDWLRISGPTPSSGTGPNGASKGRNYLYLEASGNYNKSGSIVRELDLTSVNETTMLGFDYMIYGANGGSLRLTISNDGDHNVIPIAIGKRSDSKQKWERARISLESYIGSKVKLTITGSTGSGYRGDVALDNIVVYEYQGKDEKTKPIQEKITHEIVTSVPDFTENNTILKLSPNPAETNVNVSFYLPEKVITNNAQLEVYNIIGEKVHSAILSVHAGKNNYFMDVSKFISGIYIIKAQIDNTMISSKLVVR